jgi:hypothetical protein
LKVLFAGENAAPQRDQFGKTLDSAGTTGDVRVQGELLIVVGVDRTAFREPNQREGGGDGDQLALFRSGLDGGSDTHVCMMSTARWKRLTEREGQ